MKGRILIWYILDGENIHSADACKNADAANTIISLANSHTDPILLEFTHVNMHLNGLEN